MKMSVKRMPGAVHVRGGRVLVASHDHQVPISSYDARPDDVMAALPKWAPSKRRSFDWKWAVAKCGDLAIEIVSVNRDRVTGYAYLSGDAINLIRYVSDTDRGLVAGWFSTGNGVRFKPAPTLTTEWRGFVGAMMDLKYGGADVAACEVHAGTDAGMESAMEALAHAFSYTDESRVATAHVVAKIEGRKSCGSVHLQPPKHASDYACQPFFVDLVLSSPELADHEFKVLS